MAGSDKTTHRVDSGRDSHKSEKSVSETKSGEAKQSLKERDAEWGFEPGRGGMATEAKMGMAIVVILVGAFGFLVYHKFDLKQRQLLQANMQNKNDSGSLQQVVEQVSPGATEALPGGETASQTIQELVATSSTLSPPATDDKLPFGSPEVVDDATVSQTPLFSGDEPPLQTDREFDVRPNAPTSDQTGLLAATENPFAVTADDHASEGVPDAFPPQGELQGSSQLAALDTANQDLFQSAEESSIEEIPSKPDFSAFDSTSESAEEGIQQPGTAETAAPLPFGKQALNEDLRVVDSTPQPLPPAVSGFSTPIEQQPTTAVSQSTEVAVSPKRSATVDPEPSLSQKLPSAIESTTTENEFAPFAQSSTATESLPPSDDTVAENTNDGRPLFGTSGTIEEPDTRHLIAMADPAGDVNLFEEDPVSTSKTPRTEPLHDDMAIPQAEEPAMPQIDNSFRTFGPEPTPVKEPVGESPPQQFQPPTPDAPSAADANFFSEPFPSAPPVKTPDVPQDRPMFELNASTPTPSTTVPGPQETRSSSPNLWEPDSATAKFVDGSGIQQTSAADHQCEICDVKLNDTYWTISKRAYGTARYFSSLALYNRNRIPDPRRLRPGMKVLIPPPSVLEAKYPEFFKSTQQKRKLATGYFLRPDGTAAYRIGERETLSEISQKHLGRASRWIQIFQMNRQTLKDPNKLKPGTVIVLPNDATDVHLAP